MRRPVWLGLCVVLALQALAWHSAGAAPKAELWPRWQAHDPASLAVIDHGAWGAFLERYLVEGDDGVNRVAYAEVTAADRAALNAYLAGLAAVPVSAQNRAEQMAYWINLYNALTLQVVLDHYPVDSIRDINISPGLFSGLFNRGPWGKKLIEVEGEALSLDDIEHRILRPIWADPRVHYAVNCASIGCPDLQPEPYRGATIDAQLDAAARDYVNDPRGVAVTDGELIVSSIYEWFKADFGGDDRGVIEHLQRYAAPALAASLERFPAIDDDRYDWRLNDARAD
jgi:hypothetical protein